MVLEWLFRDMKSNPTTSRLRTQNLCVEYHLIKKEGCELINLATNNYHSPPEAAAIQRTMPTQLIVFIYRVDATHHDDDFLELCRKHIIPIIITKKMPFILCLDHTYTEDSAIKSTTITLMRKAAIILRESLVETHDIIVTDFPSGKLYSFKQR